MHSWLLSTSYEKQFYTASVILALAGWIIPCGGKRIYQTVLHQRVGKNQ